MAREFGRTERLQDEIQRILAHAVQFETRDPRIGIVNINDVVITRDLSIGKVYVTFLGKDTEAECEEAVAALNHAAGFFRSIVAKELNIRITPRLQFIYDKTAVRGQALSHLIDTAVAEDEARHHDDD